MSWTVTWRPGEADYLVEGDEDQPIVVVRPRVGEPEGREQAQACAEYLADNLNALERAMRRIADGDEP